MKEYFIERIGESMCGSQIYKCQANSKAQALEIFESGKGEFVEEEYEFSRLDTPTINDVYTEDPDSEGCSICGVIASEVEPLYGEDNLGFYCEGCLNRLKQVKV